LIESLTPVFLKTDDIILSTVYTLGLHMNSHSNFNFEHQSNYSRHSSGKWLENPEVHLTRGLDTTLHYWKDVVEHLAPARFKSKYVRENRKSILYEEAPWVIDSLWVSPEEKMNEEYLRFVIAEKEFGLELSHWAVQRIGGARAKFGSEKDYEELFHLYQRTAITAELYLYGAKAYYGFRAFLSTPENPFVTTATQEGLDGLQTVIEKIRAYPYEIPEGQYSWRKDADGAEDLYNKVTNGWEVYGGKKFSIQ
jgi:hypothetical protein